MHIRGHGTSTRPHVARPLLCLTNHAYADHSDSDSEEDEALYDSSQVIAIHAFNHLIDELMPGTLASRVQI